MTADPQEFIWTRLITQVENHRHLRYYQLQEGDDLPAIVAGLDNGSANTLGLILCNIENSYNLCPELVEGQTDWIYPILVVTAETGQKLQDIISRNPGRVEVEVSLVPSEHTGEKGE